MKIKMMRVYDMSEGIPLTVVVKSYPTMATVIGEDVQPAHQLTRMVVGVAKRMGVVRPVIIFSQPQRVKAKMSMCSNNLQLVYYHGFYASLGNIHIIELHKGSHELGIRIKKCSADNK